MLRPAKKYRVVPGKIRGKHFVSPYQLIALFWWIDPRECVFPSMSGKYPKQPPYDYPGYSFETLRSLIPLRPQEDGDYSLEKATVDFVREKLT